MFQPETPHLPLTKDNTIFAKFPSQTWFSLGNPSKRSIFKDLVLTTFPNLRTKGFCFYSGLLSKKYRKEAVYMWGYRVDCHGKNLSSTQDPKWNF